MHHGFDKRFIKAMGIFPKFQKNQCLFLISRIMKLYIRCILGIKRNKIQKICFGSRMTRLNS
jgi:hypothetical protein